MSIDQKISIFLVDDDALYLTLLQTELSENQGYIIKTFANGELCLDEISEVPDIIVLDYHLNGIEKNALNGLDTLRKIKIINPDIPVIMLSSQDKIEVAVNCMKLKAVDYIVKSETAFARLNYSINNIMYYKKMENIVSWYMENL